MTDEQSRAFEHVPGMVLVAEKVEGRNGVLVQLDKRLFLLSRTGLLYRWKTAT